MSEPLQSLLDEAEKVLVAGGAWSPQADAEALAAHVLGVAPDRLEPELPVGAAAYDEFRRLVSRRARRIPLEYLTGLARFGGLGLAVGPGVFVPRFPTELVLAWGLDTVRAVPAPVVVDLCTGSGAVALATACARPDATIHAVDLDPTALDCARRNAADRSRAGDPPIRLHAGDVADPTLLTELDGTVDLVLANPPYVPVGTVLLPEWGEHHPRQAVFAGTDGLDVIREVIRCAARLLRPGGGLAIEHGDRQIEILPSLLAGSGVFTGVAGHRDQEDRPRYTTAFRSG